MAKASLCIEKWIETDILTQIVRGEPFSAHVVRRIHIVQLHTA
ncbi:hypothetical protein ACT6QH_09855 [Xanthobacter sp. TB0139]